MEEQQENLPEEKAFPRLLLERGEHEGRSCLILIAKWPYPLGSQKTRSYATCWEVRTFLRPELGPDFFVQALLEVLESAIEEDLLRVVDRYEVYKEEPTGEPAQNGGSFFNPGDEREAAEVWCELRAGKWPEKLPLQRVITPSGKAAYLSNSMMVLGAKALAEFLGLDKIGNELWERRIWMGRDPAKGCPAIPKEEKKG